MCGIAGIVGPLARQESVEAMIRAIAHRGPDGSSATCGPSYAFGHARLAIIDLATGDQPMRSASTRWLIVFNGEIYNYRELRKTLEGRYAFHTQSDTEVILAAVETCGIGPALAMLEGMYAIALFDRQEQRLHIARDHFGVKPLYYTAPPGGGLAFASEMKAFPSVGVSFEADPAAIATQLLCRFIPAPHTGRRNVFKLRPGEWRTFDADGAPLGTPRRIVPLTCAATAGTQGPVDDVASLMADAVRRQTVSDVPVGMLLSGGIDSALVTQSAARVNADLHTYCVGYSADDDATEFAEASETAALLGTTHKNIVVAREDFSNALRHAIWHLEEPVATTSLVTFSLLCKAVAAERKVVLSGQGADEPWAGYSRHRFEALYAEYGPLARGLRPLVLRWSTGHPRMREVFAQLGDETLRWIAYRSLFPIERIGKVVGPALMAEAMTRIASALEWAEGQSPNAARDPFNRLLVRDSYTDLSDNLLLLSDKLSMSHGLEVRVPLLDVAYASHVLRLPRRAKRTGLLMRHGKAMHKQVASRTLPPAVVHRRKKGFETPLQTWLAGDFGRELRDRVFAPDSALSTHVHVDALFDGRPDMTTVGHQLQQQMFSLWLTNEWLGTLK